MSIKCVKFKWDKAVPTEVHVRVHEFQLQKMS